MPPSRQFTPPCGYKVHTIFSDPAGGTPHSGAAILTPRRADRARSLELLYEKYHRPEFRGLDPIIALDEHEAIADREIIGLIAAALAYGNVKAILRGVDGVIGRMGQSPYRYVVDTPARSLRRDFHGFRYRVTSADDMSGLLIGVKRIIETHGGINACFAGHVREGDQTVVPALGGFVEELCAASECRLYHLVPHPERGSACKRLMLYLRWMVRRDTVDPGGWVGVHPRQLVIPLDTHMHRMALRLRLTERRQPNLRTAIEVTQTLRRYAPDDPLRYDFALTRPGILRAPFVVRATVGSLQSGRDGCSRS